MSFRLANNKKRQGMLPVSSEYVLYTNVTNLHVI